MRRLIYCISWVVHQVERFPIGRNSYIRGRISMVRMVSRRLERKCKMCASRANKEEDKKVYVQHGEMTSYTFHFIAVYV